MPKLYKSFWIYALGLPAVIVAVDQWTKKWATGLFDLPFNICEQNPNIGNEGYFLNFSPVVDWAMTCNQGVSFGMLSGDSAFKRWALTLFAAAMCVAIIYFLSRTKDIWSRLGLSLVLGGAIGNGIDRFLHGSVTDFVSVGELLAVPDFITFLKFESFFPWVFNVADSAISVGVAILLAATLLQREDDTEVKN